MLASLSRAARRGACRSAIVPVGLPPLRRWASSTKMEDIFYDRTVEEFAQREPRLIKISYLLGSGKEASTKKIQRAEFVRDELLIRLARTIRNFQNLPYIVCINPHVHECFKRLNDSFAELRECPPVTTEEKEEEFTKLAKKLFQDTSDTVTRLSLGIKEVRQLPTSVSVNFVYLDKFITKFLIQRLSRRVMVEHHLALHDAREDWVGVFCTRTNVPATIQEVAAQAQEMCQTHYGLYPEVKIIGDKDVTITYIPAHLEYVLLELFKNSMRAVVERRYAKDTPLHPIVVRVCGGDHLTLVLSDVGGGVNPDKFEEIWSYGYTTVSERAALSNSQGTAGFWQDFSMSMQSGAGQPSQFAGFGFGLPTCRVYVAYLGGEMRMINLPGYGTDVYLRMPHVDDDSMGQVCI